MSKDKSHSLSITDRGVEHVHRFVPSCSCGWIGVPRRRFKEAESQYRDHVNSETTIYRRRRCGAPPGPRKLTPVDKLPEELRQSKECA